MPLTQVGLPLDYARPEPSPTAMRFCHRGRVLPFAAARPPNLTEARTYFISEQPGEIRHDADRLGRCE
jgi:hypothetical protein